MANILLRILIIIFIVIQRIYLEMEVVTKGARMGDLTPIFL
jgi:hypothetical protein